jgi:hypothetical protein
VSIENLPRDNTQAPRRPNAAAPSARLETNYLAGIVQGKSNYPAVIIPAITEVTAERDIDSAVEKRNRGALILGARIEMPSQLLQSVGHEDRSPASR